MKKMLSLIIAIAMVAAGSVTALAIDPQTTSSATDADVYTTTGTVGANEMVTLLIYSGATINQDSIQYIDQTTADSTGAFKFENYKTKVTLKAGESYTVKVGGESIETPYSSTISKEAAGFTLAGKVTFVGTTAPTITLTPTTGDAIVINNVAADGTFSKDSIPAGTYKLVVAKPYHLGYTDKTYDITADVSDAAFTIKGGNLKLADEGATEVIDIKDLTEILSAYNTSSTGAANINETDGVDIKDLSILLANYGATETIVD